MILICDCKWNLPNANRFVITARQKISAIRRENGTRYLVSVPGEFTKFLGIVQVPKPPRAVFEPFINIPPGLLKSAARR